MQLLLIRHGETVDNVASLYAGSRDSELTNHGVQQGTRLGQHFATTNVHFTHIFSSQLKRAVKTAELVRVAQPIIKDDDGKVVAPVVAQIIELAEQDFGSYEGVSFMPRQADSKVSGKEAYRAMHKDDPDFVDVESKDSLIRRVDIFLDDHLMPIVQATSASPVCVAVVSHGITLSYLWRRLLHRMPPRSVVLHPDVLNKYSGLDLERIGGWANTGYLELDVTYTTTAQHDASATPVQSIAQGSLLPKNSPLDDVAAINTARPCPTTPSVDADQEPEHGPAQSPTRSAVKTFTGWAVSVHAVNSRQHLVGLKRTGGGVGSSRHDDKQRSIDTFFKKRKIERELKHDKS